MRLGRGMVAFVMVVLAASAWTLLTTVFVAPAPRAGVCVLLVAGLLSMLAVAGRFERAPFARRYLVAVPLLAAAAWVLDWPLSLGALVLAAALLLAALFRRSPGMKTAFAGLALLGVVLVACTLTLGPTLNLMSRWHVVPHLSDGVGALLEVVRLPRAAAAARSHIPHLSDALAAVLNLLGAPTAAGGDSVTLVTVRECWRFPVSPELLGFPSAALALVGALVAALCLGEPQKRLRTVLVVLVTWVVYLPLRAVLLLLLFVQLQLYVGYYSETVRVDILWDPWWQLASFVPLAVVWALGCRRSASRAAAEPALARYRPVPHTLALAASLAAAVLITLSVCRQDVGTPARGRVIIQEHNSDWEKSTRAPGTRWFGPLSMYNMFSISDYLSYHYELVRNTTPLTRELLKPGDVLILKTPTRAYAQEEVEAVVDFVRRGGGLFLVGEHTNYAGTTLYLNAIARRLGLRFRYDCLFNLAGSEGPYVQVWRRPTLVFHPITTHLPMLRFEVSCSVTSDSWDWPRRDAVMLSNGLFQLTADYFMENYYPYPKPSSRAHFGPFMQFAAHDFGEGRVAAFTDSTVMSNFSALHPGRAELVLSAVDWLGRRHSSGSWRWTWAGLLGVLLLGVALGAFLRLPDRIGGLSLLSAGVLCGCVLSLAFVRAALRRDVAPPEPHTRPPHVAFLRERCDYELPIEDFTRDSDRSYDLFYQWVLRVRYFPRVRETLEDALTDDLVVLINPRREFSARDVRLLRHYVETGGRALVLLRPAGELQGVRSLLNVFAVQVDPEPLAFLGRVMDAVTLKSLLGLFQLEVDPVVTCRQRPLVSAAGRPTGVVADSVVVRGGETLYRMDNLPAAAAVDAGAGKLVVVGFGDCFKDSGMGYTNATFPDAQLKARFRLQFELLQLLLPPDKYLPEKTAREVAEDTAWMK